MGPAFFVFDPPAHPSLVGEVISVDLFEGGDLTPAVVREPSMTDMAQYVSALRQNYYPEMPLAPQIDVVVFRLVGDLP